MFQRALSRTVIPMQMRFIGLKSSCPGQHKQIFCFRAPCVPTLIQPVRNYAYDIDEEIAKLKHQQIPDQDIPEVKDDHSYELLNVRVFGYDCTTVEHFAQFVHKQAKRLELNVFDSYAMQTKSTLVTTLHVPGQAADERTKDFNLITHERIVQLQDLSTTSAPMFLELVQVNMPEGVTLRIEPHSQEHYKDRFVKKEIPESLL